MKGNNVLNTRFCAQRNEIDKKWWKRVLNVDSEFCTRWDRKNKKMVKKIYQSQISFNNIMQGPKMYQFNRMEMKAIVIKKLISFCILNKKNHLYQNVFNSRIRLTVEGKRSWRKYNKSKINKINKRVRNKQVETQKRRRKSI